MKDTERSEFHGFLVENRASVWLCFSVACVAATMMHPTGASLLAMLIIGCLLAVLRWVAHVEGRYRD